MTYRRMKLLQELVNHLTSLGFKAPYHIWQYALAMVLATRVLFRANKLPVYLGTGKPGLVKAAPHHSNILTFNINRWFFAGSQQNRPGVVLPLASLV